MAPEFWLFFGGDLGIGGAELVVPEFLPCMRVCHVIFSGNIGISGAELWRLRYFEVWIVSSSPVPGTWYLGGVDLVPAMTLKFKFSFRAP